MLVQGFRPHPWPEIDASTPPPAWLVAASAAVAAVVCPVAVVTVAADGGLVVPPALFLVGLIILAPVASLPGPFTPLGSQFSAPAAGIVLSMAATGAGWRAPAVLLLIPLTRAPCLPWTWRWQLVLRAADAAAILPGVIVGKIIVHATGIRGTSADVTVIRGLLYTALVLVSLTLVRNWMAARLALLPNVGRFATDPISAPLLAQHVVIMVVVTVALATSALIPMLRVYVVGAVGTMTAVWAVWATVATEHRQAQLEEATARTSAAMAHLQGLYASLGRQQTVAGSELAQRLHDDVLQQLLAARMILGDRLTDDLEGTTLVNDAVISTQRAVAALRGSMSSQAANLDDVLRGVARSYGASDVSVVVDEHLVDVRGAASQRLVHVVRRGLDALVAGTDSPPDRIWVMVLGPVPAGAMWDGRAVEVIVATDDATQLDGSAVYALEADVAAPAQVTDDSPGGRAPQGGAGVIIEVPAESIPDLARTLDA